MRQIKKIIGGMLCCVLITGLFSVPVDASKKKAATTDTETTETVSYTHLTLPTT